LLVAGSGKKEIDTLEALGCYLGKQGLMRNPHVGMQDQIQIGQTPKQTNKQTT
jgi:hypothetical protein